MIWPRPGSNLGPVAPASIPLTTALSRQPEGQRGRERERDVCMYIYIYRERERDNRDQNLSQGVDEHIDWRREMNTIHPAQGGRLPGSALWFRPGEDGRQDTIIE